MGCPTFSLSARERLHVHMCRWRVLFATRFSTSNTPRPPPSPFVRSPSRTIHDHDTATTKNLSPSSLRINEVNHVISVEFFHFGRPITVYSNYPAVHTIRSEIANFPCKSIASRGRKHPRNPKIDREHVNSCRVVRVCVMNTEFHFRNFGNSMDDRARLVRCFNPVYDLLLFFVFFKVLKIRLINFIHRCFFLLNESRFR